MVPGRAVVSGSDLLVLVVVVFLTSAVSVVTGSTSLITVPAMLALGIDAHTAVATNMAALTFMSVGAMLPSAGRGVIVRQRLLAAVLLTAAGSILGALALIALPADDIQRALAIVMLGVLAFVAFDPSARDAERREPSAASVAIGYAATFLLAIYGGFFSGGYVTMLTVAFVACLGMTFLQAVATTKVLNVVSSGIATTLFAWRGLVDWPLALGLGVAMFVGAILGSRAALRLSPIWLRRIFVAVALGLAMRLLL